MFKKLKDKIEEVRQTPPRLPVQSLAQTAGNVQTPAESRYSPFRTVKTPEEGENKEENNGEPLIDFGDASSTPSDRQSMTPSTSVQQFIIADEDGDTSKSDAENSSRLTGNFQAVDLSEAAATSSPNPVNTRTSSESSFQGEASFATYTPPPHIFHPQSDIESASEFEDASPNLDQVPKAQIYQAFQKTRQRYHRYRSKYAELIKLYREQENEKEKIKTILSENQDKALRRIAELREESQLEKQAKADLEDTFRIMLDEKDELINVLHMQVRLLKDGVPSFNAESGSVTDDSNSNSNNNSVVDGNNSNNSEDLVDLEKLKEKNKKLEILLNKCKESMKANKERISRLTEENNNFQEKLGHLEKQLEEKNSNSTVDLNQQNNEDLIPWRTEVEKITEENKKLQELIKDNDEKFQSTVENKNHQLSVIKNEIHLLENNFTTTKLENDELMQKLNELTTKSFESEKIILDLQQQNSDLQNNVTQKSTEEQEELKKQIDDLQHENNTLQTQISDIDKTAKKYASDLIDFKNRLTHYEDIAPKMAGCLPSGDSTSVDDVHSGFCKIIGILQSEIDSLYCKLHRTSGDAEDQERRLAELQEMSESWSQEKAATIMKLQDIKHQLIQSENENTLLNDQVSTYKQQVTNAALELQKQQFTCNNVMQENERLAEEQHEYKIQVNSYEKEMVLKDQEISQILSERFALEETVNALRQELQTSEAISLKEENQNLGLLLEKLEKENNEKETTLKEMMDELGLQKVMRTSSSEAEENCRVKMEEQEVLVMQLEKERHELRVDYENKLREIGEKMAKELDCFKKNENLLQEEVENIRRQHVCDRDVILEELSRLEVYRKDLDEKSKRVDEFSDFLPEICDLFQIPLELVTADVKSLVEQMKKQREDSEKEKSDRVEEVKMLKENHNKVLADLRDKTSSAVKVFKEKVIGLKQKIMTQKENFDEWKKQSEQQLRILENQRVGDDYCKEELDKVRGLLEEKEKYVEGIKSELVEAKRKEEELIEVESALRESLQNVEKMLTEEVKSRQEDVERLNQECGLSVDGLKIELQLYQNQTSALMTEREELWVKMSQLQDEKVDLEAEIKKFLQERNVTEGFEVQIAELRKELETTSNSLKDCKKLNSEVQEEKIALDEEMKKIIENDGRNQEEKFELVKVIEDCKNSIAIFENELMEQRRLNSEVQQEKLTLDEEIKKLTENFNKKSEESNILQKASEDYEKDIAHLQQELSATNNSLAQYKKLHSETQAKLAETLKAFDSKDEHFVFLQKEIAEVTKNYDNEKDINISNSNVIQRLQMKVSELEQSLNEKSSIHQTLLEENNLLQSQIETTQMKCNVEVDGYVQKMEDLNQLMETKLQDLKKKAEQRLAQIKKQLQSSHEDALNQKDREILQLQQQLTTLETTTNLELQTAMDELSQKLNDITKEKQEIELQLTQNQQQLQEKFNTLEDEFKNREMQFTNEREFSKTRIDELQNEADKTNEELKKLTELKMIQNERQLEETTIKEEIEAIIDNLKEEVEQLKKELATKNAQIDESLILAQENSMEMEKALEKTRLESRKIAAQLKKREDELGELKNQDVDVVEKLKSELMVVSQQKKELEDQLFSGENSEDVVKEYERRIAAQEDEHADKIKQLVKDFTSQLNSKEQEQEDLLYTTIEKLQTEKSQMQKEYQTQIQEMVSDLREKENAMDSLVASSSDQIKEREEAMAKKLEENETRIKALEKEHLEKIHELDNKTKSTLTRQLQEQSEKYEEEIRGLTKEWNQERKLPETSDSENKELEEQNRMTIAAMESGSGSTELLRQEVISQTRDSANLKAQHKNEMYQLQAEVSRLQRLLESTSRQLQVSSIAQGPLLNEPTQMEYLRNILFEYMMGRETTTLSKVIAAVVKFSEFQTQKILEREESRHNVLAHLLKN